jgi:hypothetical protein
MALIFLSGRSLQRSFSAHLRCCFSVGCFCSGLSRAVVGKSHARELPWIGLVGFVLVAHCSLLVHSATLQSPTCNELGHLAAGVSNLTLRRFDLYRVNPPLVRCLAAIPAVLSGAATDWKQYSTDPLTRAEWQVGSDFFAANGDRAFNLLVAARWTCVPFGLIGAVVCCAWARELYGATGGIIAVVMWCFCPFVLGHGSLITADVPSAALGAAACYAFWRWLRNPIWPLAAAAGVVLGLAELTKTTLLVFYPLWGLQWIVYRLPQRRRMSIVTWLHELCMLAFQMIVSIYIINLGYFFEGSFHELGDYQFQSSALTGAPARNGHFNPGNRFAGTLLASMPVPFPKNYVQGIDTQKADVENGGFSYLCGQWSESGWWYYYVFGLLLKLPLGTILLCAMATSVWMLRLRCLKSWRDELMVLLPAAAIFLLVSSQTTFSAHCRYVIPALPFLYVWAGRFACVSAGKAKAATRIVMSALLAWVVFSSLAVYPHSLSYFNELVGGPLNGPHYLLGSNVDWGQDLLFLKKWLKENPTARPFGLAYYGYVDPSDLGVGYSSPPAGGDHQALEDVPSGWYAVSVNCLFGDAMGKSRDAYVYFRRLRPVAHIGYSISIFHVQAGHANNQAESNRGSSGDRMRQGLAAETGDEVLDGELGHAAASLDRRAAQVGSDDNVGHGQ